MTSTANDKEGSRLAAVSRPLRHATVRGLSGPRTIVIFLRRDLAEGRIFRTSLMLDLGFGLINLVIFLFISRLLQHPSSPVVAGSATYFDFVAVGMAYLLVMQATCSLLVSRVQEQQRSGMLEVVVASPVSAPLLGFCFGSYPTLMGMLRSAVYFAAAVLMLGLNVQRTDWLGVAVVLLVGALAAMGIGICLAAVSIATNHGGAVSRVVLVCVGFLSGVYFPVAALPAPLSWISAVLPTRIAIDGLRAGVVGAAWVPTTLLLAVTTAVGLPISAWLFGCAIEFAKRSGTLVRS